MSDYTHNDSEHLTWPRPSCTPGVIDTKRLRVKSVTDQNGNNRGSACHAFRLYMELLGLVNLRRDKEVRTWHESKREEMVTRGEMLEKDSGTKILEPGVSLGP